MDASRLRAYEIRLQLFQGHRLQQWPRPSDELKEKITEAAQAVLDIRKRYMDADERCSLATLYDPTAMPPDLVKAHAHLDALVDKAYGLSPSFTDADRVAHLFKLYAEKVNGTK